MNSLYVTVSIPLLLVLAGFNHAHGLTTFGKSNSQGQQTNHQPTVQPKPCTSQVNCTLVKGTTCIRSHCLCGDNSNPVNGRCNPQLKYGHSHLCISDEECVEGAICQEIQDKQKPSNRALIVNPNDNTPVKICQCVEGSPTPSGKCGGETLYRIFTGLIPLLLILVKLH